jgi:hypothetical protein
MDMACNCGASLSIQEGPETFVMMYMERFVNAHESCGYMSSAHRDVNESTTRYNYKESREKEF